MPDRPPYPDVLQRALARRNFLWHACLSWKEDDRIDALIAYCTALCGGDEDAGAKLASDAIWS
jgi:hypothetical protein